MLNIIYYSLAAVFVAMTISIIMYRHPGVLLGIVASSFLVGAVLLGIRMLQVLVTVGLFLYAILMLLVRIAWFCVYAAIVVVDYFVGLFYPVMKYHLCGKALHVSKFLEKL